MRPTLYTLVTVLTLILFSSPVSATLVLWEEGTGWEIKVGSERQVCHLFMAYEGSSTISVSAGGSSPVIGVLDRNLKPLLRGFDIVEGTLAFSNGESYRLVAEKLQENFLIAEIPNAAVIAFATAASMDVRVRGILVDSYSLTGTYGPTTRLSQCVEAMHGDPA